MREGISVIHKIVSGLTRFVEVFASSYLSYKSKHLTIIQGGNGFGTFTCTKSVGILRCFFMKLT